MTQLVLLRNIKRLHKTFFYSLKIILSLDAMINRNFFSEVFSVFEWLVHVLILNFVDRYGLQKITYVYIWIIRALLTFELVFIYVNKKWLSTFFYFYLFTWCSYYRSVTFFLNQHFGDHQCHRNTDSVKYTSNQPF